MSKEFKYRTSYRSHFATFRGVHNASKTKVLIILYLRKYQLRLKTGLNVRELHTQSGVNYDYLRSRLGTWCEWEYVSRRAYDDGTGRPMFYYTIAPRGEHFIQHIVPKEVLNRYLNEINQYHIDKKN